MRSDSLVRAYKPTQSCGCLKKEQDRINLTKNHKHKMANLNPLYGVWVAMKQRCENPSNPRYEHWGGRGIKVCDEWLEFDNFYYWALMNGYEEGLSIDRINVDGDYEPSNCRWITLQEQNENRRTTIKIEYNGKVYCLKGLCKELGCERNYIEIAKQRREGKKLQEIFVKYVDTELTIKEIVA